MHSKTSITQTSQQHNKCHLKPFTKNCTQNLLLKIRINKQYSIFKKHSDNKNEFKNLHYTNIITTQQMSFKTIFQKLRSKPPL